MNSYSQHGEDKIVSEIFGANFRHEQGRLLDIGAWGVKDLSNSRAFIELGWNAVLCEFSPAPLRALVQEYGNCASVQVVAAAITPIHQHCLRFQITDDALSAVVDSSTTRLWKEAGGYFGSMWVPTVPLKDIVNQFFHEKSVDYVSIDTEGTSVELCVELLNLGRRPRAIVVEHDCRIVWLMSHAEPLGYTIRHTNETNLVLELAK